ncbi:MAG: hypothetical protein NC907_00940 [Candidatus Omnitrophica bacterium]|nr:hypothetical protein [Candidatus Omnitrophota bacterium]
MENIGKANGFLLKDLAVNPECYGLLVVSFETKISDIESYLKNSQISGFKVYHILSKEKPTLNSSISGYLPEKIWEIAHHHRLVTLLHVVKRYGLAEPDNYL